MSTRNSSRSVTPYACSGRRQNSLNSSIISEVPSFTTIIARSNYGSRVPRTGDKNVEAVILSDPDRTWF